MDTRTDRQRRGRRQTTPFETFLAHTDEKERSALALSGVLENLLTHEEMSLLDVGSGTGLFLKLALEHLANPKPCQITMLEPDSALRSRLRQTIKSYPLHVRTNIAGTAIEEFQPEDKFHVLVVSHVPLGNEGWSLQIGRMLGMLHPGGTLVIVLKEPDEVYRFQVRFRSQLSGQTYAPFMIGDAINTLRQCRNAYGHLKLTKVRCRSELRIPLDENPVAAATILGFLLNVPWKECTPEIQAEIMKYVRKRKCVLRQSDVIVSCSTPE
jgi:precorrin-6B methylase 2